MNEIVTHMSVPRDHPSLPGHFPDRPIVPGVVLLDLVLDAIRAELGATTTLHSIISTKFLRAVGPEASIDIRIKFVADEGGRYKARFNASHANQAVLEGSFSIGVEQAT